MQFLTATWAQWAVDGSGDGLASPHNAYDAIATAGRYLCDHRSRIDSIPAAVLRYNPNRSDLADVLDKARAYSQTAPNPSVTCGSFQSVVQSSSEDFSSPALAAVRFACAQLGKPYVWGGNGEVGFDCSGLTHAAYAAAGIDIPRTAQAQYDAGPRLPAGTPPHPGDLVFFGGPGRVHHVGISLGGTLVVHAPDFGQVVQVADYRDFTDYAGASRPGI
jgi:cell wall-associated NlpC family hydrolase